METHLGLPSAPPSFCLQLEGSLHLERVGEEGHPLGPHRVPELLFWPPIIVSAESPGPNQPSPWTLRLLEPTEVASLPKSENPAACREVSSWVLSCFSGAWTLNGGGGGGSMEAWALRRSHLDPELPPGL